MSAARADARLHLVVAMTQSLPHDADAHPLDVFLADHYRIRAMLALLQSCARGAMTERVRQDLFGALTTFLTVDLARHFADEEDCLFPLLHRRLTHSDLLDPSLRELLRHHGTMRRQAMALIGEVQHLRERPDLRPSPQFRRDAAAFARAKHSHIAAENAVLIPIARERLGRADIRLLARCLAKTRPPGVPPAPSLLSWPSSIVGRC